MIKELLRKYLLKHSLNEAVAMKHFTERVFERVDNIREIKLGHGYYLPNVPIETQNAWIINQIKEIIKLKIKHVLYKDYPIDNGVCVLVPLGKILVKPVKGQSTSIIISSSGFIGSDYYMSIYDNRVPTIVLADPSIHNNSSHENQLSAHIRNTIDNKWPVNKEASFIDASFDTPIIIKMAELRDSLAKAAL